MASYTIIPTLGLKSAVPHDSGTLFQPVGDGISLTHCVDCLNISFNRKREASAKSVGHSVWSNSANAQATKCLGLFELKGSATTDHIFFDNGKMYVYDSSLDPVNKDVATPVTFATDDMDLYSILQYGDYLIFADRAEHTPYKWKNGDANLTKLILSGTEYKFRYLEKFQRRIIGAYSDQTNGDIEIRWTDPLPTWASLDFDSANQLYKSGNDSITGIKRFGANACFLYGNDSIDSIDYYPNYEIPFTVRNVVANQGAANHHSIVDTGRAHYFYNKNYGFVAFVGTNEFPYGGIPISEPIEDLVETINPTYTDSIVGVFIPFMQEICWSVPLYGTSSPNYLIYYHVVDKTWRIEQKTARYIDVWRLSTNITWTQLIAQGYSTWNDLGNLRWADFVNENPALVFANTDGKLYASATEATGGDALNGYRTEPIMQFGNTWQRSFIKEIWFSFVESGNYSVYCYYRGGDTVGECNSADWEALPEVSANNSDNPVIRTAKNNRYHQIKWGTDGANEPFVVNKITFEFELGSIF